VDGGNTKTIALLARRDGTIVGAGRAGCGDIYGVAGEGGALANIEAAVTQALQNAGLTAEAVAGGVFSLAGADWPEDFAFLQASLGHLARRVRIVNDGVGALRAGSPDGTGVVVVCGTGAATAARAPDGRVWHSSFWQEPQGGEHLARQALWAVYRADLGIDPPTDLIPLVLRHTGCASAEEMLHRFTARSHTRPPVAGLARLLLDTAQAGDPTARRLVTEHGAALGDTALAAARRVGIAARNFWLVLAGGVLRHPSPVLRDALVARVRAAAPAARPLVSRFEPAVGALLLAFDDAAIPVDDPLLARLTSTLPPAALFSTE
jgi:N-acetylglucosamine kinase-like BadF-type ATPase